MRRIVVAYDDPASVTLERAAELVELVGAELIVTSVTAPIESEDAADAAPRARAKLDEARRRLAGRELPVEFQPGEKASSRR